MSDQQLTDSEKRPGAELETLERALLERLLEKYAHTPEQDQARDRARAGGQSGAGEQAGAPQFVGVPSQKKGTREKRRRKRKPGPKFLTQEQIGALFASIKVGGSVRDLAIFRVMYHRGLRASEISLLRLEDYRQGRERLYVRRTKGSLSGEYALTTNEVRALRAWLRVRGQKPGPLFPSRRRQGIGRKMLAVLMQRYAAAAGIPRELAHCHALKHSCGTHLADQGEDVLTIKDWLGHANVQNTMIYTQVSNKRRDEAAERLRAW